MKLLRLAFLLLLGSMVAAWAGPPLPKAIRIGVAAEGVGGRPYSYRMSLVEARARR